MIPLALWSLRLAVLLFAGCAVAHLIRRHMRVRRTLRTVAGWPERRMA